MVRTAALVLSVMIGAPASAQSFHGFLLGAPQPETMVVLRNTGAPTQMKDLGDGYETWFTDEYVVSFCKGRLWVVSRKMGTSFEAFARAAELATAKYGPGLPSASYKDGDKRVSMISLRWRTRDYPQYDLSYYQIDGKPALSNEQAKLGTTCK